MIEIRTQEIDLGGDYLKSEQNFKIKKDDGLIVDLHDIGVWVESFHIYSPNVVRNKIKVPGLNGAYQSAVEIAERHIHTDLKIEADNMIEFDQLKHKLYDLFFSEANFTIIRDLTPDKEIYACYEGQFDITNITPEDGEFRLDLTMLDPFVYGPEQTLSFPSDHVAITNAGTAEADPIFELEVLAPITFAMIQNQDDEYMLIGKPSDDDVIAVDTKISKLYENASTIGGWTPATIDMVDSQFIDSINGVMGSDGGGIRPSSYGTPGDLQRGAAVYKELPNAIQDFEIESTFDIISNREEDNFRMGIYFHDENMNNLGHLGIKDNSRAQKRRVGLGRAGHYRGSGVANGNAIGDDSWINNNARDTTLYYLRVKREGQRYSFYIGEWLNFRHTNVWEGVYNDVNHDFHGKLKYITLFIGSWQDRAIPSRLRMNSVEVFELTQATVDQTPYFAYPGDIITFDHKNDEILLNGEDATRLKDFGASYFKLKKGQNELIVQPNDSFNASASYRNKNR